ncbi:zinc knuckle CX2CX4HX4C containing protein, partial [Tanacetum coccineum]
MDNASLKSALMSSLFAADGLVAKVCNIEGKIRMPVRNVSFTMPLNDIANAKHVEDGSNKVQSMEDDSQPSGNVHTATNSPVKEMNDVHGHSVGTTSFASILQHKHTKKTMAVSELRNDERVEGAAVVIPMEVVKEVSSAFNNTLYGYFIGKRLAFPLVENYVKNTWAKFGLRHVMHKNGFFFFQFSTREGMEKVLESGPWLVRFVPLILNIWSPNAKLTKDEVNLAPVWVKLHNVPILAYSEIGLSLIATQLGRPIMFDSYTSSMCLDPWGKCTYARVLIEMRADKELMDSLVVVVPFTNGKGHSLDNIEVEY